MGEMIRAELERNARVQRPQQNQTFFRKSGRPFTITGFMFTAKACRIRFAIRNCNAFLLSPND
jgi:hypothetical protein